MEQEPDIASEPEKPMPTIAELRGVAMFAELEDRVLERLAAIAELRLLESGIQLYGQGDLDVPFCLLLSGQMSAPLPTVRSPWSM